MDRVLKTVLMLILVLSLTSCKAAPPDAGSQESANSAAAQAVSDTLTTSEYQAGTWLTNYEKAMQIATEENKPVLVNFTGSDWCSWCIKLAKEVFDTKEFHEYAAQNLVLLKLDFPRRSPQSEQEKAQNEALARKYGVQGFPTLFILDKTGKTIAQTQYRPGGANAYIEHLKSLINK